MTPDPPPDFSDPRLQPDFAAGDWPLCDGREAPAWGAADRHERRCLEFLTLYYQINRAQRALLEARAAAADAGALSTRSRALQAATGALENGEDRYAPAGFFGEPVMDGIFYRNIEFVRPELPRMPASSASSHVCVPGLEDIPASELAGEVRMVRLGQSPADP